MHSCVHLFNVAAGKDGGHFNEFIYCCVVCEFEPGINIFILIYNDILKCIC